MAYTINNTTKERIQYAIKALGIKNVIYYDEYFTINDKIIPYYLVRGITIEDSLFSGGLNFSIDMYDFKGIS